MAATLSVQRATNLPAKPTPVKKTIACGICASIFKPVPAHRYLEQAPQLALESAFMSMCHFCFRCRRPACPNCWDEVHGLCGVCVEDVHLTFRQEVAPLPFDSSMLLPVSSSPVQQHAPYPLVCMMSGRFQAKEVSGVRDEQVVAVEEHTEVATPERVVARKKQVVESEADGETRKDGRWGRIFARIERVLTYVLSVVLLLIVLLVVAASLSAPINDSVLHLLHIDIRMEIRYLVQIIRQLASGG